jgi:hypothetical protein
MGDPPQTPIVPLVLKEAVVNLEVLLDRSKLGYGQCIVRQYM